MIKLYKELLIDVAFKIMNNGQFCNLLILDLNNVEYKDNYEEYVQKIKDTLSISSYIIKNGGNIIIITNDIIKDVDLDIMLTKELLWNKRRTIIYNSKLRPNELLASEYNYIFWYSDNYRVNDPIPICNNFDNGKELSDFWGENVNILEMIIKMFSKENDIIFNPCDNDEMISKYCEKLNRNYILVKNDKT